MLAGNSDHLAAQRLTAGSVRAMYEGRPMAEPWLQFLQIKMFEKANSGGVHYKYPAVIVIICNHLES